MALIFFLRSTVTVLSHEIVYWMLASICFNKDTCVCCCEMMLERRKCNVLLCYNQKEVSRFEKIYGLKCFILEQAESCEGIGDGKNTTIIITPLSLQNVA